MPRIITPIRKKETNNIAYSLNDSENLLIVPLVLPNINLSKKDKNSHPYIKKNILIKNIKIEKIHDIFLKREKVIFIYFKVLNFDIFWNI